jgi:condensin complex subunit 1
LVGFAHRNVEYRLLIVLRFGVAEQAINTIYALGEHPDRLCDELIRSLALRAFTAKPPPNHPTEPAMSHIPGSDSTMDIDADASAFKSPEPGAAGHYADSFEFAQVLAVVGHVAIKQLVYLEIVERELKRQKNTHSKGMFFSWQGKFIYSLRSKRRSDQWDSAAYPK